jgi:hypothetical protein
MGENTSAKNQLPHQVFSVSIDTNPQSGSKWFDDDGRPKRTGNFTLLYLVFWTTLKEEEKILAMGSCFLS